MTGGKDAELLSLRAGNSWMLYFDVGRYIYDMRTSRNDKKCIHSTYKLAFLIFYKNVHMLDVYYYM
jgi:hypothetical protein